MFRRKRSYYYYPRESSRRDRRQLPQPARRRRKRGMGRLLADFLSWFCFLMLITGVLAGGAMYVVHTKFDDALRRHVEAKLRAAYPNHIVTVEAARRVPGQGIELKGITIQHAEADGSEVPMIYVGEMVLRCDTAIDELVTGTLDAEQIVLSQLQIHAIRQSDRQWNVSTLLPLPSLGGRAIPILIKNSSAQIDLDEAEKPLELAIHELKMVPQSGSPSDDSHSQPVQAWDFEASISGPLFTQVAMTGSFDVSSLKWSAAGQLEGLKLGPELAMSLPGGYQELGTVLRAMQVTAHANFQASSKNVPGDWCNFKVNGKASGSIKDERLPVPVTDLTAEFICDGESLQIQDLRGRAGQAAVTAQCHIGGFSEDSPCSIIVTAERLQVNRQLVASLPSEWREIWSKVAPEGDVDARMEMRFDGYQTTHSAVVDCRNVDFAYHKFPYRLSSGQGRIAWRDGVLQFTDFTAYAHGRKVRFDGEVTDPGPNYSGFVEVRVEEPVPIDEKLIGALPDSAQRLAHQLRPSGLLTLWARFDRKNANSPVAKKQLKIGLKQCSMQYALFPYPLTDIHGLVTMVDDRWELKDLEGINDSARVLCNGGWGKDEKGVTKLSLHFTGTDVPLEDELRNALPADAQQVWKCLNPRGAIDTLDALIHFDSASRKTNVEVTADKGTDQENVPGRTITIKPTWLPYQLDEVQGTIHYEDGVTQLTNVRGRHNSTLMSLQGTVQSSKDGKWQVEFDPINVDRMEVTHELTTALPRRLGEAITRLHIDGPVSMRGAMVIKGNKGESSPTSTQWDLGFDMENGGIHCGLQLDHIHGGMKLIGSVDQKGLMSRGSLDIDSLVYQGIQFTRIQGPISLNDQRLGLGEWISEEGTAAIQQPVTARVFGGTLSSNGEVTLSGEFPFRLQSQLNDADLATISREATARRHEVSGRTFAELNLVGTGKGTHTLRGSGSVQLRDADVYQLPVMLSLLKLLRIKPPDGTAFTSSDLAYHIEGDRICFDKIHFDGDAISLDGTGDMTLSRKINLTCFTSLGSDKVSDSLFRPLFKEAGRHLTEIRVTGTLDDPQIQPQPLSNIRENIQSIFPGVMPPSRPAMSRLPNPNDSSDRVTPPR